MSINMETSSPFCRGLMSPAALLLSTHHLQATKPPCSTCPHWLRTAPSICSARGLPTARTWVQDARRPDVLSNVWEHDSMPIRRQRIAYVQSRGPGCFDTRYYLAQNKDLAALSTPLQLWDHFVTNGQFEARSFRWAPSFLAYSVNLHRVHIPSHAGHALQLCTPTALP